MRPGRQTVASHGGDDRDRENGEHNRGAESCREHDARPELEQSVAEAAARSPQAKCDLDDQDHGRDDSDGQDGDGCVAEKRVSERDNHADQRHPGPDRESDAAEAPAITRHQTESGQSYEEQEARDRKRWQGAGDHAYRICRAGYRIPVAESEQDNARDEHDRRTHVERADRERPRSPRPTPDPLEECHRTGREHDGDGRQQPEVLKEYFAGATGYCE